MISTVLALLAAAPALAEPPKAAAGVERPAERIPTDIRRVTILVRDIERSLKLYRDVLGPAGADLPGASEKLEGAMTTRTAVASTLGRLVLGPDRFFDGRIFDPSESD